ncbi:MAG: VWA domain-containing protein, partial [Deltaproteobacteria bacterium]
LKAGPDRTHAAVDALAKIGLPDRADFFYALEAMFVSRPEERVVFAHVFRLFWRDPRFDDKMMAMMLPAMRGVNERPKAAPGERRAAEALLEQKIQLNEQAEQDEQLDIDASATASSTERLRNLDFEQMSADDMRDARQLMSALSVVMPPVATRRIERAMTSQRINRRRTLAQAFRTGGEISRLAFEKPRLMPPNLVILCDISGSMSAYSRAILHFAHIIANQREQPITLHAFTFGTQLTNITRHLARRDVDQALALAGQDVSDWDGGTRIGDSLHVFNRDWSRRVLTRKAVVLLITDGLERGDSQLLALEMERMARSARSVIWVNPLLRYAGYEPLTQGAQAILPFVSELRPGHNISSLQGLAEALSRRSL